VSTDNDMPQVSHYLVKVLSIFYQCVSRRCHNEIAETTTQETTRQLKWIRWMGRAICIAPSNIVILLPNHK